MPTTELLFPTRKEGDRTVIQLESQVIIGNRKVFKQRVLDLLEDGVKKIDLDMADCTYIDASGLGVLVSIRKRALEMNADLRVLNLSEDLKILFEITQIVTLFNIVPNRRR